MEKKSNYQVFMEETPEAAKVFNGLIQSGPDSFAGCRERS
jgi:hypothetical protein